MSLDKTDLRIDTFTTAPHCPVGIRITHIPSGFVVTGETVKSRYKLRQRLLKELEEKVRT